RVAHLDAGRVDGAGLRQCVLDRFALADQQQPDVGNLFQEVERRGHGDRQAVVTTHAVDSDAYRHARARGCGASLLVGFRLHHFLAAIKTVRADVVAPVHFAGGRLDRKRGIREEVVRAVHAALGRRLLVLLDGHDGSRIWLVFNYISILRAVLQPGEGRERAGPPG